MGCLVRVLLIRPWVRFKYLIPSFSLTRGIEDRSLSDVKFPRLLLQHTSTFVAERNPLISTESLHFTQLQMLNRSPIPALKNFGERADFPSFFDCLTDQITYH